MTPEPSSLLLKDVSVDNKATSCDSASYRGLNFILGVERKKKAEEEKPQKSKCCAGGRGL